MLRGRQKVFIVSGLLERSDVPQGWYFQYVGEQNTF